MLQGQAVLLPAAQARACYAHMDFSSPPYAGCLGLQPCPENKGGLDGVLSSSGCRNSRSSPTIFSCPHLVQAGHCCFLSTLASLHVRCNICMQLKPYHFLRMRAARGGLHHRNDSSMSFCLLKPIREKALGYLR